MSASAPRRWDLYRANLNPAVGREQAGAARPVLVVSNDGFNAAFPLVTVLPLTSREGKQRPVFAFEVLLPAGAASNPVESIIMPHQVRTIARDRLVARMGRLSDPALQEIIELQVMEHLGIDFQAGIA